MLMHQDRVANVDMNDIDAMTEPEDVEQVQSTATEIEDKLSAQIDKISDQEVPEGMEGIKEDLTGGFADAEEGIKEQIDDLPETIDTVKEQWGDFFNSFSGRR